MRQLKIKTLEEQFKERVDCIYESFEDYPSSYEVGILFAAYEKLSNALDISFNIVSVLVWAIKNNGESFSASEVAEEISASEWEVNRAVNELSRLSYMELHMDEYYRLFVETSDVILTKYKWHYETIQKNKH